ncbi:MAG: hypothetical protein A3B10_01195 [Candidatus Doudnabacteria bacterium RIFCSPLOWO2_01_FULL_44_21]|uniref:DUF458 domain-containing protein n=1 Tax=Candidatus Doudnabacteria bacterium RIFCSPLOWO2_01_FULL_44_21 TaxID=1817841 RepID=A0A1F5PWR8_9BACT|nr:MAG: hypothetical protein A3B95_04105 [Candidatus Doudnabacteria bacterium RIFCSPHIGHO2_02_FULL_43_13b]OGE94401.1 MAG: hypothetical protein A3B10_01195 [Candidatus Doudnabacteria bacterium RIFCSPLOWO2_01_FULL_44_21]
MLKTQTAQVGEKTLFFNDFRSPTYGQLDFDQVLSKLFEYIQAEPGLEYELIIGTDSIQMINAQAEFVSAIVVHRKSRGGIYFWSKRFEANHHNLRNRIFQEALLSLKLAEQLLYKLKAINSSDFNLTIHVDIGPNGETKKMMNEIIGMIVGNGFAVKTKPDSYGASSVADRHT